MKKEPKASERVLLYFISNKDAILVRLEKDMEGHGDAHAFMRFPHFSDCLVFRFKEFEPLRREGRKEVWVFC